MDIDRITFNIPAKTKQDFVVFLAQRGLEVNRTTMLVWLVERVLSGDIDVSPLWIGDSGEAREQPSEVADLVTAVQMLLDDFDNCGINSGMIAQIISDDIRAALAPFEVEK